MSFRMSNLHLTLARSQGQDQGHIRFDPANISNMVPDKAHIFKVDLGPIYRSTLPLEWCIVNYFCLLVFKFRSIWNNTFRMFIHVLIRSSVLSFEFLKDNSNYTNVKIKTRTPKYLATHRSSGQIIYTEIKIWKFDLKMKDKNVGNLAFYYIRSLSACKFA